MTRAPNPITRALHALGIRRRASATHLIDLQAVTPGQAVWTPQQIDKLLAEGYEAAVWSYAALQAIARIVRQTRWLAYQGDNELERHPVLDLLRRPNEDQSAATFLESAVNYYITVGNTYIEGVAASERTPPVELWVKRPDRMRVIPGQDGIKGYRYSIGGRAYDFEKWQIRHLKTWAPLDDYYGMGAIQAAARGIDLFNVGQASNLALMQNGMRPTGAWVTDTTLDDKTYTRMKQELREQRETRNRAAALLLEAGVKWQELGITPRELDYLAGQVDAARQIHAAYGVHPVLTGLESGTFENQRLAQRALLTNVVLPILDTIVDELNAWLIPRYGRGDLRVGYDRDAYPALAEDEAALWDRAGKGYAGGWLTQNEARVMTGYGEIPGGDTFKPSGFAGLLTAPAPAQVRQRGLLEPPRRLSTPDATAYAAERIALQFQWEQRLTEWIAERFEDQRQRINAAAAQATSAQDLRTIVEIQATETSHQLADLASWWLAAAYAGGAHAAEAHDFPTPEETDEPDANLQQRDAPELFQGLMKRLWGIYFKYAVDKALIHIPLVVGQIEMTTKQQLMAQIAEGITQGLSIPNIAKLIDTLHLDEIIPNRSVVIARTETISSTNYGSQLAARATGLTITKNWHAHLGDDRTRPAHLEAHGQSRPIDQPYIVDGEPLDYPGDPNGSAANVIQCRCSETYREVEEPQA